MKLSLIICSLALAVCSVVIALFVSSEGPAPSRVETIVPVSTGASTQALLDEVAELRARLAKLEMRPAQTAGARVPVMDAYTTKAEFDAFRESVLAALEQSPEALKRALNDPNLFQSGDFKDGLAGALSEIRQDEAAGKAQAKMDSRYERLDDTIAKFAPLLGLNDYQSREMRTAYLSRYDREAALLQLWQDGGDERELGEQKRTDRDAFQSDLALFLTPEQLETHSQRRSGK